MTGPVPGRSSESNARSIVRTNGTLRNENRFPTSVRQLVTRLGKGRSNTVTTGPVSSGRGDENFSSRPEPATTDWWSQGSDDGLLTTPSEIFESSVTGDSTVSESRVRGWVASIRRKTLSTFRKSNVNEGMLSKLLRRSVRRDQVNSEELETLGSMTPSPRVQDDEVPTPWQNEALDVHRRCQNNRDVELSS